MSEERLHGRSPLGLGAALEQARELGLKAKMAWAINLDPVSGGGSERDVTKVGNASLELKNFRDHYAVKFSGELDLLVLKRFSSVRSDTRVGSTNSDPIAVSTQRRNARHQSSVSSVFAERLSCSRGTGALPQLLIWLLANRF